jgi:hypothetical protein
VTEYRETIFGEWVQGRDSGCISLAENQGISEAEFWERVNAQDYSTPEEMFEGYGNEIDEDLSISTPCPVCSATQACGYDDYGRPWIHVNEETE